MSVAEEFVAIAQGFGLEPRAISSGPEDAEIAFIGEGLGEVEIRKNAPFVGKSGQLLWKHVARYGLAQGGVYSTNVIKRQISASSNDAFKVHRDELAQWQELLRWELAQLPNLKTVVLLGNYALSAILNKEGIGSWRGSVVDINLPNGKHGRAICANNPAYLLHEPKSEITFMMDMQKVGKVITGKFKPHVVDAIINPGYRDVMMFMDDLMRSDKPVAADIEGLNGETACMGLANEAHRAICINFRDADRNRFTLREECEIWLRIQKLFDSHKVIAQNGGFDAYWCWLRDWLRIRVYFDTLLAHHTLYPQLPHNLGYLTAQYTNHPYYKDEGDYWKEGGDINEFWVYNCLTGDTKVLRADLSWDRLDNIKPGDKLLSFEEHPSGARYARKLKEATVTKIAGSRKQTVTVILSNGQTLQGTHEHRVIKQEVGKDKLIGVSWATLGSLSPGDLLPSLEVPWELENTRDAGWLSGIFDGEGTAYMGTSGDYPRVAFCQKPGMVLNKACNLLRSRGFALGIMPKESATYVDIQGGLSETLRLLGTINPIRLTHTVLSKALDGFGGFSQLAKVEVLSVFDSDEEPVYDITTTTGTFIANGLIAHNCRDAAITWAVAEREAFELKNQKLDKFFFDHVMRAQPHLVQATVHGLPVDTTVKAAIAQEIDKDVNDLEREFHRLVHECVDDTTYFPNPASWQQLRELFFGRLSLNGVGLSTDKTNRDHIMKHARTRPVEREMLAALNKYKTEDKFRGTYAQSKESKDGRFRFEFKQFGVQNAPGRLSSSALINGEGGNIQNQPMRARGFFIADPGCVYIYFDLAQAEAQVVSFRADIPKWKEQFARAKRDGSYDCHRALASEMFNVPYAQVPTKDWDEDNHPTMRYISKRCRHGLNYRMERFKLSEVTGLPYHTAARAFMLYHRITPELQDWWAEEERVFKKERMLFNALGRRFRVLQPVDDEVSKSVVAFYPQSTIGDKVVQVWYQAEEDDDWPKGHARVAINVHDNLVGIAETKYAKVALRILKKYAESPLLIQDAWGRRPAEPLSIGADCKISYPTSWDEKTKRFVEDAKGLHRWSNMKSIEL